jgi:hypothetical protein
VVRITVEECDWGGFPVCWIRMLAEAVANAFAPGIDPRQQLAITLARWSAEYPQTDSARNERGDIVIHVTAPGANVAQFIFQFAHEFCHALADPVSWRPNSEFGWIEESLAEVASAFALRRLADLWETQPPDPLLRGMPGPLRSYWMRRVTDPAHMLPPDTAFADWVAAKLPELRGTATNREYNTIIANQWGITFYSEPAAWRVMAFLHAAELSNHGALPDFIRSWHALCPSDCQFGVKRIADTLGVDVD